MEFLFGYTNIIVNGVIILITILNVVFHKLRKHQEEQYVEQNHRLSSLSIRGFCYHFSLDQMKRATSNFDEELVIGKGGFGKVYKGTFELGPKLVAIKRLESTSNQGSTEFRAEIEMLSKHRHSHLVSLIGYCDDSYEMILVYEFMPGGTLADHLYKRVRKGDMSLPPLSWVQRLKICIGAARGLDYLHTGTGILHRTIHRDVKSTNILLDENLAAKISDFGLSKISPANQASTYVSTHVKGTFGYLDPYYFSTRRLTKKSDVYSFGVVLFEVLCGRPAVDRTLDAEKMGLAGWAQHCFREGLLDQIIDPRIKGEMDPDSLEAFVKVAIQCLHIGPKHRPNMGKVVVKLESALALQEKNTEYILAETTSSNYNQGDVDFSKLDMEIESSGKGSAYLSNGGRQENQSSGRMTLAKRFGVFLSLVTRAISVYRDKNIEHKLASENLKKFELIDLERATYNFKEVLGEGRSGKIFKGWIHERTYAPSAPDIGLPIAVKRFVLEHAQGLIEWKNEIDISREYSHPNFVKLLGYCSEGQERLLVYEYKNQSSSRMTFTAKPKLEVLWTSNLRSFSFNDLSVATRKFHPETILGRDSLGCFYMGWVDENTFAAAKWGTGLVVEVKKFYKNFYGDHEVWLGCHEAVAEINFLGKLCHPNIVKLIGYCLKTDHRLLVYEFMPQRSLDQHLFRENPRFERPLSWKLRMSIALGAAKGLAYLHSTETNVIHGDIQTACILIDSRYNAKLSGFRFAKDGPEHGEDHVSVDVVRGTTCYVAPEYLAKAGLVTKKIDVYNFGVALLEILAGKSASSLCAKLCIDVDFKESTREYDPFSWAEGYLTSESRICFLMDADMQGQYTVTAALKASSLANKCLSLDPKSRPDANQMVEELEQLLDLINSENVINEAQ